MPNWQLQESSERLMRHPPALTAGILPAWIKRRIVAWAPTIVSQGQDRPPPA